MKQTLLSFCLILAIQNLFAQWSPSGNNIYNTNSGNVGIGTASPTLPLSISTANGGDAMRITNTNTQYGAAAMECFVSDGSQTYIGQIFGQWSGLTSPSVWQSSNNIVITPALNSPQTGINLLTNGHVGIGTTAPGYPLDVNGAVAAGGINVNSNTTKFFVRNNAGKTWALSAGENNVNETNFGIYDWTDNQTSPFLSITSGGNVLIGKTSQINSSYLLDVAGTVRANAVAVNTNGADFVFDPGYTLTPLTSLGKYVRQYHHLPGVEPAAQMQAQGMNVGDMTTKLLQKIEELTLYAVAADKRAEELQAQLKIQQAEIDDLRKKIAN
ncbi:MAG TPA: hypothetical protein VL547_18195 [Dinghuibacter sp.]|uniref:hypothetical protein n=1 Tax=Dinghuibacter sp. TaxID=2024697 RepID=UPI002B943BD9|nr:hypothetical protein [Dinghuibacter sp.]HTJ13977.1 hypothetical protein [Dinghuibacter sp.]